MNISPIVRFLGSLAGAAFASAVVAGPLAHADESGPSFGDPWFFTTWPEPSESEQTSYNITESDIFSQVSHSTYHYTNLAEDGTTVIGEYDTESTRDQQYGIFHGSNLHSETVTDSSGVGPPVGTDWDSYGFDLRFMPGPVNLFQLPMVDYESIDIPDGLSGSFIKFFNFVGNEFVSGPEGMADYLYVGGDFIPIFDTLPD